MKSYFLKLVAIAIVASVFYFFVLSNVGGGEFFYKNFWIVTLIFFVISLVFHNGLVKSNAKGGKEMVRYFMGATGLKILAILVVVIGFFVADKQNATASTIAIIFNYLVFSVYEVVEAQKVIYKK